MWEQFFSPTNRYCEMLDRVDWFSEMELCVPPEVLLNSRRSVHDFYSFAQNHVVVWMSPHAFITTMTYSHQREPLPVDAYMHPQMHHMLTIGSRSSFSVFASEYAPGIAACDFLLCFLAKSKVPNVSLRRFNGAITLPVSFQALSHFLGQATLATLELYHVCLDINFGHALTLRGLFSSSTDFNLTLECCSVHPNACEGEALAILVHGLQSITGALEVNGCWIDSHILAAALSGDNCHLKKLKLSTAPSNDNSNIHGAGDGRLPPIIWMDPIARSVQANNTGLVELVFGCMPISDRDVAVLCDALVSHATVTTLDLSQAQSAAATPTATSMWPQESTRFWLQKIVLLIKANTVLQTVKLPKQLMTTMTAGDICWYQEETVPRLEMNRFRPRLETIRAVPDTNLRAKLLAHELTVPSVQHSPDLIWMLISENEQLVASYRSSRKRKRHRADVYA
jgi:hypothetical protein